MNQRHWWKKLLLIVAIMMISSVGLAACGDDEEDDAGDESTTTTQATTGTGAQPTTAAEPTEAAEESTEAEGTEASAEPTEAEATEASAEPTEAEDDATETIGGGATDEIDYESLEGSIEIDGSSTVYPVSQAVAEEFTSVAPDVQIQVAQSGTGGGFERFCLGETQISDASRPIADDEIALCEENGVEWTEIQVGVDGLSVVVNSENDFVDCLTVEQLGQLWAADSDITTWSQLDPSWPEEEIALYGPGTDSGTYDFFVEEIIAEVMGEDEASSRGDYTASEDDQVIVQGIIGDTNALGYFGYAYYVENQDSMNVVSIDGGEGCVEPNPETVESNEYSPLSRPLFIYVNNTDIQEDPAFAGFIQFYLNEGLEVVPDVGYISMSPEAIQEQRDLLMQIMSGS